MTPRSKDSVGAVALDLVIDGKSYNAQIKNITRQSQKQLKGIEGQFTGSFGRIAKIASTAFIGIGIGKFVSDCLNAGSALTEVQNVVDVAFPTMNKAINEFAKNAITQFGLSETIAKKYSGTFGAMAKSFGFAEKQSADMAMALTGLAGDVASFYNMSGDEAYTKLKSVFTGETETLKDLGVVMTQSALDQYALANSYGKTTAKMTEQEKVALRFAFVQEKLSSASGDFIRTQDSWANQTRVLSLRFESLKASLGKGFIALFTPIIKGINWVLANLQILADSFANMMEFLTGTSSSVGGSGALAETSSDISTATDSADGLSSGLGDAGKAGEKAAKKINKAFAKVDTINKLTFDSGDSDAGSGSGGGSTSGSVADATEFPKATEQANVFSKMMDGIVKEFQRLSDIFVKGFELGFGDTFKNIQRIKDYVGSIGDSIVNIFTSSNVVNSFSRMIDSWVFSLGAFTGSMASIAVTTVTLFVGSIATYLERNVDFIKDRLVSMFDITSNTNLVIGFFYTTIADIASVFASPRALSIGSDFMQVIFNSMMAGTELFLKVANSIITGITKPIINSKSMIKKAIEDIMKPISEITSRVAKKINSIDMNAFNGLLNNIKGSVSGLVNIVGTLWTNAFQPVIESILNGIIMLWDGGLSQFIDNVSTFLLNVVNGIMSIWNNALNPLIEMLLTTFLPIFTTVFDTLLAIAIPIIEKIMEYANMFMDVLNSLMDILNEHVLPMFKVVFDGISKAVGTFWEFSKPIFDWFMELLGEVVSFALDYFLMPLDILFQTIVQIVKDIADPIKKTMDGVRETFQGIIDFVAGVFTGDWSKAWDGIKSIFSGMWNSLGGIVDAVWKTITGLFSKGGEVFSGVVDGIAETFKKIVNVIIDGLNKVIAFPFNKINGLLNELRGIDIPLIGQPFKGLWGKNPLPVPQVPKLAQGGYVKANQPQLAMIGDNKRYGEIVAPENKMVDMINTALRMQKDNGSVNGIDEVIKLLKLLIETINGLCLKVDIDMKKLSILLEKAKRERDMIGG